jgi:hypothetical protein
MTLKFNNDATKKHRSKFGEKKKPVFTYFKLYSKGRSVAQQFLIYQIK